MSQVDFLPLPTSHPGSAPTYRRPVLIGTYSHLPDRSITHDDPDAAMAYYRPGGARPGADLSFGFEHRTERDDSVNEHLDGLCEALAEAWSREDGAGERSGGIVTWRGMMTR